MHVFIICYCLSDALQLLGEKTDIWREETMFAFRQMQSALHSRPIRKVQHKTYVLMVKKRKWQDSSSLLMPSKTIWADCEVLALGDLNSVFDPFYR